MHAMTSDPRELVEASETRIHRALCAKSLGEQLLDELGGCFGFGALLHGHDTSLVVRGDLCNGGSASAPHAMRSNGQDP